MTPIGTTTEALASEFIAAHPQAVFGSRTMTGRRRIVTEATGQDLQSLVEAFRLIGDIAPPVGPAPDCPPCRGLGDMVANGLNAIGITKERVQAVANAVGIEDCGCEQRQEKWNEMFPFGS